MNLRIVTDSTCDLPADTIRDLGITVVPLNIHIGDRAYRDGVDLTREDFYQQLPMLDPSPKTASPGPHGMERIYEQLADEGADEILSIHISESLSATVNEARFIAGTFTKAHVTVVDSSQLSLGMGFLAEKAARMAQSGSTLDEILQELNAEMPRTHVFAALKTLEYLKRSGRMHTTVARIGEFLKIKPLLHMNQGKPVVERARTQKNATAQLLAWLEQYAPYEQLAIVHAGIQDEAEALRKTVRAYWPDAPVVVAQITPVLGAHLGVGALGFACISKE